MAKAGKRKGTILKPAQATASQSIRKTAQVSFKGNVFYLEGGERYGASYYTIIDMTVRESDLVLPESFQEYPIWGMILDPDKDYPQARTLTISQSLLELKIKNNSFPLLEKVVVNENPFFSTDGKLLFDVTGKKLLYCLGRTQGEEELVVPAKVSELAENALAYTPYKSIRFENQKIVLTRADFENTAVLQNKAYLAAGNRFMCLIRKVDTLVIPSDVTCIDPDAFQDYMPARLETPVLPYREDFFTFNHRGGALHESDLKEVVITSPEAVIHQEDLKNWEFLTGITIACDHPLYCSQDGVLFDKEKKSLIFYPAEKPQEEYHIPEGVERIGHCAFFRQTKVKRIFMPDSVKYIEEFAVMGCQNLESLVLSDAVEVIPDSNPYFSRGTLSNNRKLTSVHLPARLKYLGCDGLYNTGLEQVDLPEGLEVLGNYSLYTCHLKSVRLPRSLRVARIGSLYEVGQVTAYEGTAKGLVGAICPTNEKPDNVKRNNYWHRCNVTVLDENGEKKGDFYLPESVTLEAAQMLYRAWDGPAIDYEAYAAAADQVKKGEDRMEMILILLLQAPSSISKRYEPYLRRRGTAAATQLIDSGQEEKFVKFLEKKLLTPGSVEKLLEYSNQKGQGTFAAYLMDYKEQNGKKTQRSLFPL